MLTRWNDLSLRLRLTLLYVGLLTILLVTFGAFLYFDSRNFMISTTAFRLQALAFNSMGHLVPGESLVPPPPRQIPDTRAPITATVEFSPPPFEIVARNLARDLTWQDYTTVILDQKGAIIADGREYSGQTILPALAPGLLARTWAGEMATSITTVAGQEMLVVLMPIHYPRRESPVVGVIQMTNPLDFVDQVLGRQRGLILFGVLVTLFIGTIVGLWLTQTALTPLRVMIAVCRRIAGGDLSQRVNLPQRRDETGQLASAFDEMVARLDDAFTTQRQFVADASHELRTPLTAISGSLEVLLLAPEGDPETTRRVLHGMRREVQRLTRLVADLLTLTRLDARRAPKMQMLDLAALTRDVVEGMRSLIKNRQVVVEAEGAVEGFGDADQLKQVFYNLLDNAIHSTDAETGTITVRVQGLDDAVRVAIADNGAGIPESARARVFERFYRVDKARTRAGGGSGLGLSIVRSIVEGHGGTIEPVESDLGRGTTIRFVLPRKRVETITPREA
ncbi:MAG: HAMP domain-containing protein [Chloroflexi bacterium]|nr:HAMP domain-containing protein [Chloroflexota bacterium]